MLADGGMRVIALTQDDAHQPGFNVCIHCTYDITGNDAMYPHSSVTSFPGQQCQCGKCAASKLDQQEETSDRKTRQLHTIVQTLGTDLRYMMFGSMTSPALMRFLNGKGYASLEQMLGYSGDIDENNEWNLRSYLHPDRKKNGPAAPACDSDHCVWRLMGVLVCHSVYALLPCAHATNIVHELVREQCNDRCFWLSRIPCMSTEKHAAKEAANQLAAAKQAAKLATDCHRTFEEQLKSLAAYKAEHDNCHVPQTHKDDTVLATWVMKVRLGNIKLNEEQKQILNAMGFAWDIAEINESKRQQMVLEVCLIAILLSLSHNFTNNLSHSGE